MAAVTFTLTGDKELDRRFQSLAIKVQKKVLREGTRAAAKIVLAQAKANMPVVTGRAQASLKVRAMKRSRKRPDTVGVNVISSAGFYKGDDFYVGFVEMGHKAGPRKFGNSRKLVPGKHPIQKAYKSAGPDAQREALDVIAAGIEREAKSGGN